ncbi:45696_t:CDS:2, partial [Gigaspora margarita]
ELTSIVRLQNGDLTKVIYLNVKAFLFMNKLTNDLIELFETEDIVSATSIKTLNFDFNTMPVLGINSVIVGVTTQTVKEIKGNLILKLYIKERIGDKKASNFIVETKHNSNNKYFSNKIISINQNAQLMTVILVNMIYYKFDNDVSFGKHIIILEDLSIITLNSTLRSSKNKNASLLNMNTMLTQKLLATLGKNLIPNMTNKQPA